MAGDERPQSVNVQGGASPAPDRATLASVTETARRQAYAGQIQQALKLLNSDGIRGLASGLDAIGRARLKLARAQAMQVQTMLSRTGHEEALDVVDEVADVAERLGDTPLLADAKCLESWLRINRVLGRGNPSDTVLEPIGTCLRLRRELGDKRGIAEALFLRGLARENVTGATEADVDEAMDTYRESYRMAQEVGDQRIQSYNAYHIGSIHGRRDELDEALAHMKDAYNLRAAIGMKVFLPGPCLGVGRLYLAKGSLEEAEAYCREALRLAEEIGHHAFRFYARMGLGDVATARDEANEARSQFRQALEVARELGHEAFIARAKRGLGA